MYRRRYRTCSRSRVGSGRGRRRRSYGFARRIGYRM